MEEEHSGSEKRTTEEVYVLEHSKETNMLISGGGNDAVSFHRYNGTEYVLDEVIEGLEDSVVSACFVSPAYAVAVSMDGCIVHVHMQPGENEVKKDIQIQNTQIDVASVGVDRERLQMYIGTKEGTVERFSMLGEGLCSSASFGGHPSEVLCTAVSGTRLYTASYTQVLVFDVESTCTLKRYLSHEEGEIRAMAVHAEGELLAVGYSTGALLLFSLSGMHTQEMQLIRRAEYAGAIETVVFTRDTLQYGGFGESLNIVDLRHGCETVIPLPEKEACVVSIIPATEAVSIAVMNSGKVFVTNSKRLQKIVKECTFHSCVFSAVLAGNMLCAGTEEGVECIDLSA
ncbi:hypothetical protein NECID01_0205 [Nematocida sp. AWRm77]|nr:hypothetical protein NECID01_0205 [Nematocida sp. AWRm77]